MSNFILENYKYSLFFYILVFIFLVFLYIFSINDPISLTDYWWSFIFIFYIFIVYFFRYANKINLISVYSLFYFTTLIFLCGRFFSIFLGYSEELFSMDFFSYRILNDYEKNRLMLYVFLILVSLEVGLYLSRIIFKKEKDKKINLYLNTYILWFIFSIVSIILIISLPDVFNKVLLSGYLAIHQGQADGYSFGILGKVTTLLYALLGFALVHNNKNLKISVIAVLIIYSILYMIIGSRGTFVCTLLFLLWAYYDYGNKSVNLFKLFSYIVAIVFFLISFFSLISLRAKDITISNQGLKDSILNLLYEQGITLMVFNEVFYLDKYPLLPMIQNFIPGSIFIASKLDLADPYNISYGNYLASSLNSSLFEDGYGLGWSVFSDLYVISFGIYFIFGLFVILFSLFLNFTELMLNRSMFWKILVISTLPALLFLPRSGLYTYFPLMYYVFILYLLVRFKLKVN